MFFYLNTSKILKDNDVPPAQWLSPALHSRNCLALAKATPPGREPRSCGRNINQSTMESTIWNTVIGSSIHILICGCIINTISVMIINMKHFFIHLSTDLHWSTTQERQESLRKPSLLIIVYIYIYDCIYIYIYSSAGENKALGHPWASPCQVKSYDCDCQLSSAKQQRVPVTSIRWPLHHQQNQQKSSLQHPPITCRSNSWFLDSILYVYTCIHT